MRRLCQSCDEQPRIFRCKGCLQAWYCSKQCQKSHWSCHKFDCSGKNGPTTADYLAVACAQKLRPVHEKTLVDYGFWRAFTEENQRSLLGLYTDLMRKLGVNAKSLHRWWENGFLLSEIKEQFESLPPDDRGVFYPWFLQNEWVLDGQPPWADEEGVQLVGEMARKAWIYAGGSPNSSTFEIHSVLCLWPKEIQMCHELCSVILSDWPLGPDHIIWIPFGFCACDGADATRVLYRSYQQILSSCSFRELVAAFSSSRLYDLLLAKGLGPQIQASLPHLKDVLALSPKGKLSVWDLKRFIARDVDEYDFESPPLPDESVMVDYGFANCKTEEDVNALKDVYTTLFEETYAEPPELHRACMEGRLYDFVAEWMYIPEKKYRRLLKNPYP